VLSKIAEKPGGPPGAFAAIAAAALVCVCLGGQPAAANDTTPFYATHFEKTPTPAAMAALGRALFFDKSLSASGSMACASCHDPAHFYGPPNDLAVQRGGIDGRQPGVRSVPSLRYTQAIPAFTEHYFEDEGNDSIDQGPTGGRTWDGRAQSTHEQAQLPLLSPFEMANRGPDDVVAKVRRALYAAQFRQAFGDSVFNDRSLAFKGILMSLETFQQSPEDFYPYSSKYDAYLRGHTALTPEEARGLAAFNDVNRGNCARCHPSAMRHGAFPQFTDFGFAAVGAPRNRAIPANTDDRYHDLGLCGPLRTDLKASTQYCGMFRSPSLRNVATRRVFFHNGIFHRLEDVVRFYAERDTQPQRWFPRAADGTVLKYDDLPGKFQGNVDVEPPFDRHAGDRAALSEQDVRDIVVFLNTLTDGFPQRIHN
jgi:cytochrome c peroxidase